MLGNLEITGKGQQQVWVKQHSGPLNHKINLFYFFPPQKPGSSRKLKKKKRSFPCLQFHYFQFCLITVIIGTDTSKQEHSLDEHCVKELIPAGQIVHDFCICRRMQLFSSICTLTREHLTEALYC